MKYSELLSFLSNLSPEQLECTVTVYDPHQDEFIPIESSFITDETDVLDANHPYLTMK